MRSFGVPAPASTQQSVVGRAVFIALTMILAQAPQCHSYVPSSSASVCPRKTSLPLQATREPRSALQDQSSYLGGLGSNDENNNDINNMLFRKRAISQNNNQRRQQQPRKPRRKNAAMEDPAFLRKRTDTLLALPTIGDNIDFNGNNNSNSLGNMKVDRKTFHFLMDAWAFSGERDAAEQAQALLTKMEDLHAATGQPQIQPDVRSYTKVINAISRSASPTAGDAAERLLHKMQALYERGENPHVKPNTFTFTAVVEAHANSGAPGSARAADALCQHMVDTWRFHGNPDVGPTTRSFNAAINAYAKSGDAQRADDLFRQMQDLYELTGLEDIQPQAYNYNSLITAWANCGSAQRAEEVLAEMERLSRTSNNHQVKPTTISFNAVIDAYSKSHLVGSDDDSYGNDHDYSLEQQSSVPLDTAGEKAEELLRHMEKLYHSGENVDAKPNVRSFNSVINVWAKSRHPDAARRAEQILDQMKQLELEGDKDVRPDTHSFCTVINAWARSQNTNKAERSLNVFKEMKKLHNEGRGHLRPNVVAANAVMNACAYTTGDVQERNRAVEIAHKVLKELESGPYGNPDQVTYGTFLQVCANQLPDCSTRDQIVKMVFQKCVKDGQVGNLVLEQLKMTTSPQLYQELVGKEIERDIQMEQLPKDWWCNVVEGKRRRRRNF